MWIEFYGILKELFVFVVIIYANEGFSAASRVLKFNFLLKMQIENQEIVLHLMDSRLSPTSF